MDNTTVINGANIIDATDVIKDVTVTNDNCTIFGGPITSITLNFNAQQPLLYLRSQQIFRQSIIKIITATFFFRYIANISLTFVVVIFKG